MNDNKYKTFHFSFHRDWGDTGVVVPVCDTAKAADSLKVTSNKNVNF